MFCCKRSKYGARNSLIEGKINNLQVLYLSLGQRYSVLIKLDQMYGNYSLHFATYLTGDMRQGLENQAVVSYTVRLIFFCDCYF